ncbi:HlyD family secretion protein [Sphingomonas sp. NFR04]|uniref:HlyD family type I secretion periplasmic adaptor subunit n=1 Tax=Sphingomonas sp. NFR04 TaxID=1566283 RepID=UPI0008EB67C6|nr:HlyD family type I secretion periplasmic adaptor subunit [Sphingomonas sp. NFR04]SFJ03225.1 HlyD family secretion protein [Sphingomonas sp. NFR04]
MKHAGPAAFEQAPSLGADPGGSARDIRWGAITALLFFGLFLGWAALTRLDAAAYAPGEIVVAGERQAVQQREGGVIEQLLVAEGQHVEQGQLLIRLSAESLRAQERGLVGQQVQLLAQRARQQAQLLGQSSFAPPGEFAGLTGNALREAQQAMAQQHAMLAALTSELAARKAELAQRSSQSRHQAQGLRYQRASTEKQIGLLTAELSALAPVARKGWVSQTRLRELERSHAQLAGQHDQLDQGALQADSAVRESELASAEATSAYRSRAQADLYQTQMALNDLAPRLSAVREQLAHAEIRAPVTGTVIGLAVFTEGGVIAPGQTLMEIVPDHRSLLLRVRVSPDDAADVKVGQRTIIRLGALRDRSSPDLTGTLTRISADRLVEPRTGIPFFSADVIIDPSALGRGGSGSTTSMAKPGTPAQALIQLRQRTPLQYALAPLLSPFWRSLRER